jgi:hypothetical protein
MPSMGCIIFSSVSCLAVSHFSTLSDKQVRFTEKIIEHITFHFLYKFVRNISYSKKNSERKRHKRTYVFVYITRYSQQILKTIELPRQIFERSSDIKFHENPSSGSRVVPYGGADEETFSHDEAHSRFSNFC